MADTNKAEGIISEMNDAINAFNEKRTKMSSAAINFTDLYDEFVYASTRDATILKAKMKEMVIKGSNNEF